MDIQKLISEYTEWLKSEIKISKMGEYYEITSPFLDNANDYIQIYVKQDDNGMLILSDDGATINGLEMIGVKFSKTRKGQIQQFLSRYGVQLIGNELVSHACPNEFPQKKHMLIQAMLSIGDMFLVSRNKVSSFFLEDVQQFFEENEIYCTENVQFIGVSGFSHIYDFLIQRTRNRPERLCRVLNSPSCSTVESTIFAWNDTKSMRKSDSQLITILNDQNPVSNGIIDGLNNYNINVIKWSQRNTDYNLSMLSSA